MAVANMAKAMDIHLIIILFTVAKLRTSAFAVLTSITGKNPSNTELVPLPQKSGCNVSNLGSCHLEINA